MPAAGELLVQVTASGVNRPDVLQRKGLYPMPPGVSDLPGLEVAGTVVGGDAAELAAAGFALGDRVCALVAGGGYAQRCVAPIGPVEVTRFHAPEVATQAKGPIAVEPASGMDGNSLEWRAYQAAVQRQLGLLGYAEGPAGSSAQVAELRISRSTLDPVRSQSPVSVGIGGSTGSYGSGLGLGIGIVQSPRTILDGMDLCSDPCGTLVAKLDRIVVVNRDDEVFVRRQFENGQCGQIVPVDRADNDWARRI